MRFEPKTMSLNTTETVTFSCPSASDAPDLIAFIDKASQESVFCPWAPGKTELRPDNAAEYIERFAASEREALIIVRNNEEIIAFYEITTYRNPDPQPDRCATSPAVLQAYQGSGVARQLLEMGFDLARQAGYERSEAGVDVRNERSIAFLEKLGFERYPTWFHIEQDSEGVLTLMRQYYKIL